MKRRVVFSPAAKRSFLGLRSAEVQRRIEATCLAIAAFPGIARPMPPQFRGCVRFEADPFVIVAIVDPRRVRIVALLHKRMLPKNWL